MAAIQKDSTSAKIEISIAEPIQNNYINAAIDAIPRILSLLDRKKGSKTYGCFDRYYWRYKMIDFAGSNFQIATLPLASVYSNNYPNNPYYKKQKIQIKTSNSGSRV